MALRTTGIKLIADTGLFKREMRDANKAVSDFKDEVHDTRTESDKLGEQLGKTGKTGGTAFEEARKQVGQLDKQIVVLDRQLKVLATSFARTGDADVGKQLKEQQAHLRELRNVRSLLPSAGELAKAGIGVGSQLIGGIKTSLTGASPAALGIGALGLLMAPTLGAAVAGAVVGGAAGGGVIGGIVIASRDQRVKDAGKELGNFIVGDLENRAKGFVQPTLSGIDRIRQGWAEMGPDLDKIFESSRFIDPLADGLIKGAKGIVSGVADAIEQADPVINSFHNLFTEVGRATGDLFRSMAEDADQGAAAIDDLTLSITNMIGATTAILDGAAAVRSFSGEIDTALDRGRYWIEENSALAHAFDDIGVQLDFTADGFHRNSVEAEAYRQATLGTATAADFARLKAAGMTDAQISGADASGKYRAELDKVTVSAQQAAAATGTLVASETEVQEVQKAATLAQTSYTKSIEMLSPSASRATMLVDGLRKATQLLYGTQEAAIDANESYEASWDALSESVKKNSGSLNIHTAAGRANRDALQALLKSSRDMYIADIESGVATDTARKAHEKRTKAVEKEADKVGLNKKGTDELIKSYGRIPTDKATKIIQTGVDAVVKKFMDLYVYQRSLAEGLPIGTVTAMLRNEKGPAKRYGGYADGGHTGHGGKYEPAGIVHREEFVLRKEATQRIERENPGVLEEMNATGQMPGYAGGGWVGAFPVETRDYRAPVTANRTKTPTRAQVAAKVAPKFGDWPASPSAQRGDSGVWRKVLQLIKSGPDSGSFGNAYRAGDPLWHGSGRAVDWMGYNQDPLASYLASKRPLELIHRTNKRDYAYTRGVNKGSFNNALMEAHRNHIHIAMQDGGVIREPVLGMGASGRTYSFGEGYRPERVVPMGAAPGAGGGGGATLTVVLQNHGVIGSQAEVKTWLAGAVDDLKRKGRI